MTIHTIERPLELHTAASQRFLCLALSAVWLLGLLTFSLPGREGPESLGGLDPIALAKVVARAIVILVSLWILLKCWQWSAWKSVSEIMLPWGLFLGWAIVSVSWSPLKTFSMGQAGSLMAQLLLAAIIGTAITNTRDTLRVIFHLQLLLLAIAVFVVGFHFAFPDASGLNRDLGDVGSVGLVHPTSAGATASLGIVSLILVKFIWNPNWARLLLVPALPLYSLLLLLAASRTAIAVTCVTMTIALPILLRRRLLAWLTLWFCVMGAVYTCLDPGFEAVDSVFGASASYLARNQSFEQLRSFTGRTELWDAVWSEWFQSPLIGCGYFVTARNGLLDVWSGPANRTAHNAWLQVLASMGLIGLALFVWAIVRATWRAGRRLRQTPQGRQLAVFLLVVGLWFVGWGQLCSSFMGPIQPESIVFFCCLGLASGAERMGSGTELSSQALSHDGNRHWESAL